MNYRQFYSMKYVLGITMLITILLIILYIRNDKIVFFKVHQNNNLKDLPLNKIDKLLSNNEQIALIQHIVKESIKELRLNENLYPNGSKNDTLKNISIHQEQKTVDSILLQRLFHKGKEISGNHSVRNSNLKAFQIQTTIDERNMMYTLLETFDKVMKKNNITYFMYGGTLLGSFRHHDLIPWDDDLDVIISVTDHKIIPEIFSSLSPEFTFYRAGGHDKFYHKNGKKSSEYIWLWPYLDISYFEENGTYIKDWVKTYSTWYYFPKEIVFPLHNRPLLYLSLPAPKDTFAFLAWTYQYGSPCKMYGYSHMVEGLGPSGEKDCISLGDKFPFVEHLPDNNGIREILKYKELEIRNIVVDEPKYAVAETYKLALKTGFTMPANIIPPLSIS